MKFTRIDTRMVSLILLVVLIGSFPLFFDYAQALEPLDDFPKQPIAMIFPYPPGGASDMATRIIVAIAPNYLDVPIVARSIPGAGGAIGTEAIARATPNGYTLGISTYSGIFINPQVMDVPFGFDDFSLICRLMVDPYMLIVRNDAPWDSVDELLEDARKEANSIIASSAGPAAPDTILARQLGMEAGVEFNVIPMGGAGPGINAILSGDNDIFFTNAAVAGALIDAGEVKALAVTDNQPHPTYPDLPTFLELGYNVVGGTMQSIVGPKGIPEERLDFLSDLFEEMSKDISYQAMLKTMGFQSGFLNRHEFTEIAADIYDSMTKVLEATGLIKQ